MVRQTVELMVVLLLVRARGPDVLGRGVRRPDRLDGARRCWAGIVRSSARVASRSSSSGSRTRGKRGSGLPELRQRGLDDGPSIECGGDRVLVQKFLYDFRRPRRWEVAVFHFPGEPSQAYVKRVVGLPGESIRIKGGDIFVNGRIARKSLAEIRAMRMLVHDSRFQPRDAGRFPRWVFRSRLGGTGRRPDRLDRGRRAIRPRAARPASGLATTGSMYRHWDPARRVTGRSATSTPTTAASPRRATRSRTSEWKRRSTVDESVESISVALRSGRSVRGADPGRRRGEIELRPQRQSVPIVESL